MSRCGCQGCYSQLRRIQSPWRLPAVVQAARRHKTPAQCVLPVEKAEAAEEQELTCSRDTASRHLQAEQSHWFWVRAGTPSHDLALNHQCDMPHLCSARTRHILPLHTCETSALPVMPVACLPSCGHSCGSPWPQRTKASAPEPATAASQPANCPSAPLPPCAVPNKNRVVGPVPAGVPHL